jgi:succinate dehydrogenase/fumarate reductase flavoprotein subunit
MNPLSVAEGVQDSLEDARTYLRHETGAHYDAPRVDAFLTEGPRMIDFFLKHTAVRFQGGYAFPDYHQAQPGARAGGRPIVAEPFDGRELGDRLAELAPPLRELSFAGLVIGSGNDLKHFFHFTRSFESFRFVIARVCSHLWDLLRYGRGMRLVNGNALAARLGKSLFDLGVPLWLNTPARELLREGDAVTGAVVEQQGKRLTIRARRGVVLASGGFPHDVDRRRQLYPHAPTGREHWALPPAGNTGDGARLGESAGARFVDDYPNAAAWAPVSEVRWPDGERGLYPHFVDRGKPGVIAVLADGHRFGNESDSYHDFVQAMVRGSPDPATMDAFFIADHRTLRRYGLGVVKPFPVPIGWWLHSGYLIRGQSISHLAQRAGIDPDGLQATVRVFNEYARSGRDLEFGRGDNAYNRSQGDAAHGPNPCLGPIEQGPFYAVRIRPGELGSFAGLRTDRYSRALDRQGRVIDGLYACGNDAASVMGGNYAGGGITLGPAMTFGYIAGRHLAGAHLMAERRLEATEDARIASAAPAPPAERSIPRDGH